MLRVTFLLCVLIILVLFTVLIADNSTDFKLRTRANKGRRGESRRLVIRPGFPTSNPPGHIDRLCRICGVSATSTLRRVINGLPVSPRYKYPWIMPMAIKGTGNHFFCAGALINKRFVLTAAHCVRDPIFQEDEECKRRGVVVSCFLRPEDVLVGFMGESHRKPLGVTACRRIYVHPQYDYVDDLNDIALVELQRPVPQCNKYISPICIPQVPMSKMNGDVIVAGWGRFKQKRMNEGSQRLREGRMTEVDPVHCQNENNEETRREKIFCTTGDLRNNQSSCEGDSGSTVFASFDGVFYSLGVTSTHSDPDSCLISGVVSFASTYGYRAFIRSVAGELPSPPEALLGFSHK